MQEKNKQTGAQAWSKGQIEGVEIKQLTKFVDRRGFLCETFRLDELPRDLKPVMSYVSYTEPGVGRGPTSTGSKRIFCLSRAGQLPAQALG